MGCCSAKFIIQSEESYSEISISKHSKRTNTEIEIRINPPSDEARNRATPHLSVTHSDDSRPPSVDIDFRNFVTLTKGSLAQVYKIEKLLGEGATGFVYLGKHRNTGEYRAIKTINRSKTSELQQESIKREVEILKSLVRSRQDHPHIIKILEVIEEPRKIHIVTELCTGGELFDKITVGIFTENLAAKYMQQLMTAVAYLHSNNIVHRDLKPENLILENNSPEAGLKLIDFGNSLIFRKSKRMRTFVGTVRLSQSYYLAPEVISGSYNEQCDIWSCGVVLYLMLSGTVPFNGKDDDEVMEKAKTGVFKMNSSSWGEVSNEAKTLILKMLSLVPQSRPTALEILNDPWIRERTTNQLPDNPISKKCLRNLSKFRVRSRQSHKKLCKATLAFIATHMTANSEIQELRRTFIALDRDSDGHLNKTELIAAFKQVDPTIDFDIESIFAQVDSDGNGLISYSEFITATIDWQTALTEERLLSTFSAFDKNGNGTISVQEIRGILGGELAQEPVCAAIMKEADYNHDGQIDFEEFKKIMLRKIYQRA